MISRARKLNRSTRWMVLLFLGPLTIVYIGFLLWPAIQAFYVSLFNWSGFTSNMEFVGLRNFKELLGDQFFWNYPAKNTLKFLFIGGLVVFSCAFLLCGVLSTKIRLRKFWRALIFFPVIINPVAIAILWNFILNDQQGLLSGFLRGVGLSALTRPWMSNSNMFGSFVAILTWANTGFYCIILLAALDRVPVGLIESAKLDGASEIKIFFRIKIPLIWDVLVTTVTLWTVNIFKESALFIAISPNTGTPPEPVIPIAVQIYATAFGRRVVILRMGYAAAMGILLFAFIMLSVFLIARVTKREILEY